MKQTTKQAFSFVEIIVTLSIIILLATIALNVSTSTSDNKNNAKITSDISTLKNSFLSYENEKWTLPLPNWNNNYFKADTSYAHEWEVDIFWVYGFVTKDTLPNKYLSYLPLDPKTNQFYLYGKTDSSNKFELASVIYKNSEPQTLLDWNYPWENWPISLIRQYNWPNFVSNRSKEFFPYNPQERLLTAKISSYNWAVTINWLSDNISDKVLLSWDIITVPTTWFAEIFFSDGSVSTLWDDSQNSVLELTDMAYTQENNLVTKIKLALTSGTLWTKATSLDEDSEFDVFTQDATAAVRWTIFWVKRDLINDNTNITLEVWEIEVKKEQDNTIIPLEVAIWGDPVWVTIEWGTTKDTDVIEDNFQDFIALSSLNLKVKSRDTSSIIIDIYDYKIGDVYIKDGSSCTKIDKTLSCELPNIPTDITEVELCTSTSEAWAENSREESCTTLAIPSEEMAESPEDKARDKEEEELCFDKLPDGSCWTMPWDDDSETCDWIKVEEECATNDLWTPWEVYAFAPYISSAYLYDDDWVVWSADNQFNTPTWSLYASWDEDYLKYEDLDLTWNFAIEMEVNGEALNRWIDWNNYTLFYLNNSFRLYLKDTIFYILWKDSSWNWTGPENYWVLNYSWPTSITLIYDNWVTTLKINGIEKRPITNHTFSTDLSEILIWVWKDISWNFDYQWSDIINYVKIYKETP